MSLFRTYTPKLLYQLTLKMIGSIFVHPPKLNPNPTSYFRAVLDAHQWIKSDLNNIITNRDPEQKDVTIENIHASLVTIEQMLFGEASEFEVSIPGCCLYTQSIEDRLSTSVNSCSIV